MRATWDHSCPNCKHKKMDRVEILWGAKDLMVHFRCPDCQHSLHMKFDLVGVCHHAKEGEIIVEEEVGYAKGLLL